MANVFEGDVLRCASVWKYQGADQQVNVLALHVGSAPPSSLSDVLDDVVDYFEVAYGFVTGVIADDVVHDHFQVQNMTTGEVFGSLGASSALDGADSASQPLPPQTAALLIFPSLVSGVQGRIYLPTFTEGSNDGGSLGSSALLECEDFRDYLMAEHTMGNGTKLRYCIHRGAGAFVFPQSSRTITEYRTQKRRVKGRGA